MDRVVYQTPQFVYKDVMIKPVLKNPVYKFTKSLQNSVFVTICMKSCFSFSDSVMSYVFVKLSIYFYLKEM